MLCSRPEPQKAALPAKLISYVYFTRKINEVKKKDADKKTDVSLAMASESPQRSEETSVTDNVTQTDTDVKTKFSRQFLNDTWDDIWDKMYENEVHEDIIGEIEAYKRS